MARNYYKFYIIAGTYDDGAGGSLPFSQAFLTEDQAVSYFAQFPIPWLDGQPVVHQNVWFAVSKHLFQDWLNIAIPQGVFFPPGPPLTYLSSPRTMLNETNPDDIPPT